MTATTGVHAIVAVRRMSSGRPGRVTLCMAPGGNKQTGLRMGMYPLATEFCPSGAALDHTSSRRLPTIVGHQVHVVLADG